MEVKQYDSSQERRVLTGMVTDDMVCGRISSIWHHDLFGSKWANILASLCVRYYRKQGKAPNGSITGLYESWARKQRDEESAKPLEAYLSWMSEEYSRQESKPPSDYLLDQAGELFNRVRLENLAKSIKAKVDLGHLAEAEEEANSYSRVEVGQGSGIDLFQDLEAIKSTYDKEVREPLITYPGALGEFFGDMLSRDRFVAFMAPEKAGKSYELLDVAHNAVLQRKRVAYFQVGDLSEAQIKDRLLVRALGAPSRSTREDGGWPCSIRWPVDIQPPAGKDTPAQVRHEERSFSKPLDAEKGWAESVVQKMTRRVKSSESFFRLLCCPTRSMTVRGIRSVIESWQLRDWTPDVVVVDYADILAPDNPKEQKIDQIKTTWEELRKTSQILHCLLLTATQVNAQSYDKPLLDRRNFAGNHLKFAEVNGMVGINISPKEKELGIQRFNWVVRREGAYSIARQVHVAGCLGVARSHVLSCWGKRAKGKEENSSSGD